MNAYIEKLGWKLDSTGTAVNIPLNPDNQVEATVLQESIKLPQLAKVISQAVKA